MRRSGAVVAALVGAPILFSANAALALDIYFDQITGVAGGALGIVGGPVGGFVGGMLGRQIGRKIHPRPRPVDLTDLQSRPRVTPIAEGRIIQDGEGVEDRAVDSTPVRMIELRPAQADARTYLASAPARTGEARTYRISHHHRLSPAESYLVSAPRAADSFATPRVTAVSASVSDNPGAPPGTLDYQLNQLTARSGAVQKVADLR